MFWFCEVAAHRMWWRFRPYPATWCNKSTASLEQNNKSIALASEKLQSTVDLARIPVELSYSTVQMNYAEVHQYYGLSHSGTSFFPALYHVDTRYSRFLHACFQPYDFSKTKVFKTVIKFVHVYVWHVLAWNTTGLTELRNVGDHYYCVCIVQLCLLFYNT